jgi:hypothetical protein
MIPAGWKVVSADSQDVSPASNAIDGNSSTIWLTSTNTPLPRSLTVDMGTERRIGGFTYLPRQDGNRDGVVDTYRFETSADGKIWTATQESGRFGKHAQQPDAPGGHFRPRQRPLFPVHGVARSQRQGLCQRRRGFGDRSRAGHGSVNDMIEP